jgi:hypothetical protein
MSSSSYQQSPRAPAAVRQAAAQRGAWSVATPAAATCRRSPTAARPGPGRPHVRRILASSGPEDAPGLGLRVRRPGVRGAEVRGGLLDALNAGRLKLAGFAKGGSRLGGEERTLGPARRVRHLPLREARRVPAHPVRAWARRTLGRARLVDALNKAASEIKAATKGRTERHLLKELDSVGKSLIKHEQALNKVNKSLDGAKSKLDNLKSSASQLSDSVKSGLLSSANITQGASGQTVTVASIMGGLTQSRDQTTAFAGALKDLKAKGLNSRPAAADRGGRRQRGRPGDGGRPAGGVVVGDLLSQLAAVADLEGRRGRGEGDVGRGVWGGAEGAGEARQQPEATAGQAGEGDGSPGEGDGEVPRQGDRQERAAALSALRRRAVCGAA